MSDRFVIVDKMAQKYVRQFGAEHAYTKKLEEAQLFKSYAAASRHTCSNESIVNLLTLFGDPE